MTDDVAAGPVAFEYAAGTYNATLTVSNAAGSNAISLPITVNAALAAPIAQFVADPTSGAICAASQGARVDPYPSRLLDRYRPLVY